MRISDWSSDVCSSDLHDHEVVLGPGEALAIDLGIALALKHEIELRGGVTERRRRLPAPQQLRPVAERREDRAGRHRIDELDLHAFVDRKSTRLNSSH